MDTFLSVLFAELVPPGFLEIRVLAETGSGSKYREQRWYEHATACVAELDELNRLSETHQAAIYFGVLPRKHRRGRAGDIAPGRVLWADLDFKSYPGGEAEARAALTRVPLHASGLVASGHGLHAYWLLKEPDEPETLSRFCKRLELQLHSDHVSDTARILRLPGTWNRKDRTNPRLVAIEHWAPEDAYNLGDFEGFLPAIPVQRALTDPPPAPVAPGVVRAPVPTAPLAPIVPQLPPAVLELMGQSRYISGLFLGRDKPPKDNQGRPTDCSSSGYDYSFIAALVRKGLRDPLLLAQALAARPDGKALGKGEGYITRTVTRALEEQPDVTARPGGDPDKVTRAPKGGGGEAACDFTVSAVTVYASDPPLYALTIDGMAVKFTATQLLYQHLFEQRVFEALHRIPTLPPERRGGRSEWRTLVNGWLARAKVIEQPEDASREGAVREALELALRDLMVGEQHDDLDRDRAVRCEDGTLAVKLRTLERKLKAQFKDLSRPTITSTLHEMGFAYVRRSIGGTQARVWLFKPETLAAAMDAGTNGKHKPNSPLIPPQADQEPDEQASL